jgi:hypothetical protein
MKLRMSSAISSDLGIDGLNFVALSLGCFFVTLFDLALNSYNPRLQGFSSGRPPNGQGNLRSDSFISRFTPVHSRASAAMLLGLVTSKRKRSPHRV